jgi:DNA repair exonuclease SbcCD ATPase subunit
MSDEFKIQEGKETPGWLVAAILVLAIVAVSGFGLAWRDQTRLQQMEQDVAAQIQTVQQEHAQHAQSVASLEEQLAQANEKGTAVSSDVSVITRRLRVTEAELKQAREEAAQIRAEGAKQMEEMGTTVLTQLATKANSEELSSVSSDLVTVKTDLEVTKNDLKMARSDLGTLIARNSEEIDVLRRLGERDYVEFTVQGRKKPQVVGPLTVDLRSVDTKRNKFTVALVVDDMRTEKKDRLVNEPIFFYPRGSRQATEFVVNSVAKDKITGYISTPKRAATTTAASAGN